MLLMFHDRHHRWPLPAGTLKKRMVDSADAASRETTEETMVRRAWQIGLVGLARSRYPACKRKREPFHRHHDLIFAFEAESDRFATTSEAPQRSPARPLGLRALRVPQDYRAAGRGVGVTNPDATNKTGAYRRRIRAGPAPRARSRRSSCRSQRLSARTSYDLRYLRRRKAREAGSTSRLQRREVKWTPGVRHEVKGVIAVRCKSVAGEVAVDPLWKHLSGG